MPDCEREATHAPNIYIPATGYPQERRHSVNLIAGTEMCRSHAEDVDPTEFVPDLAKLAEIAARASGSSVPPDVSRAWVVPLRIDSEEYRKFRAMSCAMIEKKPT